MAWRTLRAPSLGILEPSTFWGTAPFQTSIGGCEKNDSAGGGYGSPQRLWSKYISMMADGGKFKGEQIIKEEIAAIQFQNLVPGLGLEAFEDAFGEAR